MFTINFQNTCRPGDNCTCCFQGLLELCSSLHLISPVILVFDLQEQMKQQQWQQQQQGVLPQSAPSQPSSGPVPPPQHRPLYQPMQPHPQHLASMGFDPRWLMMQSYMDPRMMSGRPAMDMPPIHPGKPANSFWLLNLTWF